MRYLIGFVLALSFALPVAAQDFQKGLDAYSRGDYATALHEWRPLAELGVTVAQFGLGFMYENGQGVQQDYSEAKKWHRKAAEQGHAGAQYALGNIIDRRDVPPDYAEAVKWYRKAAEQGHAGAQYDLGFKYMHGQGVPENEGEGVKWYRKAAEQGHAGAQVFLGMVYYRGQGAKGIRQDYVEAAKLFRKAAEQGVPDTQAQLGFMYENGQGVPQDYVMAYMWYNLAALSGFQAVLPALAQMSKKMASADISKAQRLARQWLVMHGKTP